MRTETRFWGRRADRVYPSASVLKAMLLVAYLRHARARPLRRDERALLAPMIRRSDNTAATGIRDRLGNAALVRLARAARMTSVPRRRAVWGISQITARDQTRFFLHLDALLPPRHRAYGLRLLRDVVPSQRWGIGRVDAARLARATSRAAGARAAAPSTTRSPLLHATATSRLSVAVLTAANGSHATGQSHARGRLPPPAPRLATIGHQRVAIAVLTARSTPRDTPPMFLLGLIVVALIGCAALALTWSASLYLAQATGPAGKALAVVGGLLTTGVTAFALYVATILVIVVTCGCTA